MEPFSIFAALLGGAGSLASGIMGANAADDAAQMNWQINLLNYYARERERRERMQFAREGRRDQKLGAVDADGNRTRFVEGQGWVSTRSPEQQQLADAQYDEQMNVLTRDLPQRRRYLDRNEQRSLEDENQADALREMFRTLQPESEEDLRGMLYGAATRGMADAFDDQTETLMRGANRTGASNIDQILRGVNESRAKAFGDAAMDARLRARGVTQQEFDQRRSNLANLYNMFATRASAMPEVSYRPQNVDSGAASPALMNAFAQRTLSANENLAKAAGQRGGTLDYIQPNYGWANAVGGGASALGSMFRSLGAQSDYRNRTLGDTEY